MRGALRHFFAITFAIALGLVVISSAIHESEGFSSDHSHHSCAVCDFHKYTAASLLPAIVTPIEIVPLLIALESKSISTYSYQIAALPNARAPPLA